MKTPLPLWRRLRLNLGLDSLPAPVAMAKIARFWWTMTNLSKDSPFPDSAPISPPDSAVTIVNERPQKGGKRGRSLGPLRPKLDCKTTRTNPAFSTDPTVTTHSRTWPQSKSYIDYELDYYFSLICNYNSNFTTVKK